MSTQAHVLAGAEDLKIHRHLGQQFVNVEDEHLARAFLSLGCKARTYSPEGYTNPDRIAWEIILPRPEETDESEPGEGVRQDHARLDDTQLSPDSA